MTSQEYTQWLKGFLDAVDNYSITKKQFDAIREKLKEVDDTTHNIGTPIGNGGWWGGTVTPYSIPLSGTLQQVVQLLHQTIQAEVHSPIQQEMVV